MMWPFAIRRERNGEKIFEMYSESVEINQDLKDSMFTLAAGFENLEEREVGARSRHNRAATGLLQ